MSKVTNDALTRSGTGCFIAVPIWHSGRQGVHRDDQLSRMTAPTAPLTTNQSIDQ